MIVNAKTTKTTTSKEGDVELFVFLKSIKDNTGVSPAAKLAVVEYNTDNTVQRKFKGNISARITGTVA